MTINTASETRSQHFSSLHALPGLTKLAPIHVGALVLVAASATTNGYSATGAQTGVAMVAVALATSVVSDCFKSVLPLVARQMAQRGEWLSAMACTALLALCMAYSGSLALSGALGSRESGSADRLHAAETFAGTKASLADAQGQLTELGAQRGTAEVDADLRAGTGVDASAWTRTVGCTQVTLAKSQTACAAFFQLEAERAKATKAETLSQQAKELTSALALLPAPKPVDPLTTAVGRIAGFFGRQVPSQENVSLAAALLLVLVLELGSALGLTVAESMAAADRRPVSDKPALGRQGPLSPAHGTSTPQTPAGEAPAHPGDGFEQPARSKPAQDLPEQALGKPWAGCGQPLGTSRAGVEQVPGLETLLSLLARIGGVWAGGQVELARALGISRSRAQRLLVLAVEQRLIRVEGGRGRTTRVVLHSQRLAAV